MPSTVPQKPSGKFSPDKRHGSIPENTRNSDPSLNVSRKNEPVAMTASQQHESTSSQVISQVIGEGVPMPVAFSQTQLAASGILSSQGASVGAGDESVRESKRHSQADMKQFD